MDISDTFSPHLVHWFRQILRDTSNIDTELLYVGSSWMSRLFSSMWRGPQEYSTRELVPTNDIIYGIYSYVYI